LLQIATRTARHRTLPVRRAETWFSCLWHLAAHLQYLLTLFGQAAHFFLEPGPILLRDHGLQIQRAIERSAGEAFVQAIRRGVEVRTASGPLPRGVCYDSTLRRADDADELAFRALRAAADAGPDRRPLLWHLTASPFASSRW